MRHEDIQDRLGEYADSTLDEAQQRRVAAHLGSCASCRGELAALRRLHEQAARLPRRLEPPRDLWPPIADRLEPRQAVRLARRERRAVWGWRLLAVAAGVALVVVSSVTTYRLTAARREPAAVVQDDDLALRSGMASLETGYSAALAELSAALRLRRSRLSPETVAVVEKNLQLIDAAIAEARAALAADPGNAHLLLAVASMYEEKVELLQRLTRIPEGS